MNNEECGLEGIALASRRINSSVSEVELAVPDIHCAGCINTIETSLLDTPGVIHARVNLTTRRVRIRWDTSKQTPALLDILEGVGFKAHVPETLSNDTDKTALQKHIRALAVAGFAAGNVMMLSLSVWSGADAGTRYLLHILSATIALPALVFSSRIFFTSAWHAIRVGRTNMDVPICVGIVLTTLLSIYDTVIDGEQVYFDAAIMLVFLLLIGRTLETRMRAKARSVVGDLARLQPTHARVVTSDGQSVVTTAVQQVARNDILSINSDERIPVDCTVISGTSSIDMSLISGESAPTRVSAGDILYSGCLNLDGSLEVMAISDMNESFLFQVQRQIEEAQAHKGRYQQLADRVVSYYTPFVHLAALIGFLSWMAYSGDWHRAITVGVAVLIITCPCALGLAVPIARVVAAHQLIKRGILMKDGAALERLAIVNTVIFDKTGTLTTGQARLRTEASRFNQQTLAIAKGLCHGAVHPYAKAINRYPSEHTSIVSTVATREQWCEVPGEGVMAQLNSDVFRFGRAAWALQGSDEISENTPDNLSCSILTKNGRRLAEFTFEDTVRVDAAACVRHLYLQRLQVEIVSGDVVGPVSAVAESLHIKQFQANARPDNKLDYVLSLQSNDSHVLMVGDGINDSPALAAASVSMVPGTGADITRKMADFIVLSNQMMAIPGAITLARRARRIVTQNLALAVGYNVVALPLAITGMVTPLVAAIAMSLSSVLVIGNSLRLASNGSDSIAFQSRENALSMSV